MAIKFGNNLLKETNNYRLVIDNEKDLSGLPAGVVAAAAETAKEAGLEGKWVFTLHNPSVMPFLQYADNRNLREMCIRDSIKPIVIVFLGNGAWALFQEEVQTLWKDIPLVLCADGQELAPPSCRCV